MTLAMLAYAACALSFALAMMFLIQDKVKTETFLAATSIFTVGIYAAILLRFEKWGGLNVVAWDAENKAEVFLSRGVRLFVTIPDLGWLMLLVFAAVAAPLVLYVLSRVKKNETLLAVADRAVFISILLQRWRWHSSCCARAAGISFARRRGPVCHQPGREPVHSFGAGRRHFRQPVYLLLLWRRAIWRDCCPMRTTSTASPTKPSASPSPCSP